MTANLKNKLDNSFKNPLLKSPFYDFFSNEMRGGSWYDWAGYKSPTFIQDEELEYFAIRSTSSLFDVTPLIKYKISGPDAENYLNKLTIRDVSKLQPNNVHYTAWCDDEGFVIDDGTLFRFNDETFRLCSQERHLPWLLDTAIGFDVNILEETDDYAGISLQGPTSASILLKAGFKEISKLKPFELIIIKFKSYKLMISRTGFTGDLGYEIFISNDGASSLWEKIWSAGELLGIKAIGFNALNLARIETGFIVANSDFITSDHALRPDRARRPDEIGLSWMVDLSKNHFNGKNAIIKARKNKENKYVLVSLEVEGKEPAEGSIIYHNKTNEVGIITSAAWSPTAKKSIALASLKRPFGNIEKQNLWVEIYALRELQYHKLMKKVSVVKRPFINLSRRKITPPLSR